MSKLETNTSASPPSSLRFLTRPRPSPPPSPKNPNTLDAAPRDSGVVVVGLLPSRPAASAAPLLLNRILDRCAFSPGALDRDLTAGKAIPWLEHRRISYYLDEERGIVFVLFQSESSRLQRIDTGIRDVSMEDWESEDLRGALFMFSVCHVIIFLHEGSRFDSHILKKFRMLQRAKNALAPFARSQTTLTATSRHPAATSRIPASPASSSSPSKTGGGRHGSSVSIASGPGSHASVSPGNCVPVILFIFYDEFSDGNSSAVFADDPSDSLICQSPGFAGTNKPMATSRGPPVSVTVLTRPASFRKKLQSSLDSQIRFLIKKCRTLVGSEYASRGAASASSLPLFSLDASRAVVLLDKALLRGGKSLDLVTSRLDDVLDSKLTWDTFAHESQNPSSSVDDIQAIKDFINRQSDSLRGKGALAANATSGSAAAGVGMVAAAAAAAAASTSAGKPLAAPKLPSMDMWESFSNHALDILLSVKHQSVDELSVKHQSVREIGSTKKPPALRKVSAAKVEENSKIGYAAAEAAISCLESTRGLNVKFSTEWCMRALPAAKEIYLRGLPDCYPTALHNSQLEKALDGFVSMVRGQAVISFARKLKDDCNTIWLSGRQLCDAVSLTGKPCMHRRHDDNGSGSLTRSQKHSSGYVFLHACACGRLRGLRDDPFDFYDANMSFNYFPSCEKFLSSLKLPKGAHEAGPLHASWSLFRLGSAGYYDPSKGMLQPGFCGTEKYLSEWKLVPNKPWGEALITTGSTTCSTLDLTGSEKEVNESSAGLLRKVQVLGLEHQEGKDNPSLEKMHTHFGKGFPAFVMKKAFSEVVAGTKSSDSLLPSCQVEKHTILAGPDIGDKSMSGHDQSGNRDNLLNGHGKSEITREVPVIGICSGLQSEIHTLGNPADDQNMVEKRTEEKKYNIYIGFEHECPRGHRFFLSEHYLDKLGSFYSSAISSSSSDNDSNGIRSVVNLEVTKHNGNRQTQTGKTTHDSEKELRLKHASSGLQQTRKNHQPMCWEGNKGNLPCVDFSYGGHGNSLLNRNLPIFMNCPHCMSSTEENQEVVNFASTVSQLQRIFLVTPPYPIVLSTSPIVKFEVSNLPPSVPDLAKQSQFSLGCRVTLPPESFLSLRLPFVYGIELENKRLQPLQCNVQNPELTGWLVKGTILNIVSKAFNVNECSKTS